SRSSLDKLLADNSLTCIKNCARPHAGSNSSTDQGGGKRRGQIEADVRFTPNNGHGLARSPCPLFAKSRLMRCGSKTQVLRQILADCRQYLSRLMGFGR